MSKESEIRKLSNLVSHDGWRIARSHLLKKIADINSLMDIVETNPQVLMIQVAARQEAAKMVLQWLFEMEGNVLTDDQLHGTVEALKDDFVHRIAEPQS